MPLFRKQSAAEQTSLAPHDSKARLLSGRDLQGFMAKPCTPHPIAQRVQPFKLQTANAGVEAMEINGPVVLNRIQINPGDLIIADDSGICAVPPQHAEFVLKKCQEILPDEEIMRELIEKDAPIAEIKKLFRKRYV